MKFKNVSKFKIYSNYGKVLPLTGKGNFTNIMVFQSLYDDSVRVSFTLADAGYRYKQKNAVSLEEEEDLKITVGEKVELKLNDNKGREIDTEVYVEEVTNSSSSAFAEMFSITCSSKDFYENKKIKNSPTYHFEGKIHEIVKKILEDILGTSQEIHLDPTLNSLPINGRRSDNPLDFCTALAPKSIPEKYPQFSGYYFYNTLEGYHFKSIDMLFMQDPKRKMIYNQSTGMGPKYTNKILNIKFYHNMNISNIMHTASLTKSEIETFDVYTHGYSNDQWSHDDTYQIFNNAGKEKPIIATELKIQDEASTIVNQFWNTGTLPPGSNLGSQLPFSKQPTFDIQGIVRKSIARYNQALLYRATITIHGDFEIYPGDIIECDFPEISNKINTKSISRKKSGKWLVCDVSHFINAEHCYTKLNIIRDSIMK